MAVDGNRARALEEGLITKLIHTLNAALASANTTGHLTQQTLLLIRAGVGALLNLSLKYGKHNPLRPTFARPSQAGRPSEPLARHSG